MIRSLSLLEIVLLEILAMSCSMTAGMVNNYYMSSYQNVGQPQGLVRCNHTLQRHLTSCIHSCASIPACASAFTIRNDTIDSGPQWECMHCENAFHTGDFPPGNGYYTVFKVANELLNLPYATFHKFERLNDLEAAVFDCRNFQSRAVRLVVSGKHARMPVISDVCSTAICDQAFLSEAVIKVTSDKVGFIFSPLCIEGEKAYGYYRCDTNGLWTSHDQIGMTCVSSTCYRYDPVIRQSFYNGGTSVTRHGIECQRWDKKVPHDHVFSDSNFPEDDFSAAKASNKCRNPETIDQETWCYTINPYVRWGYCNVPKCKD